MNKKVYFAGSIRGGRVDASLYQRLIAYINQTDKVLTEHVGNLALSSIEGHGDQAIYDQDTAWLRESDVVIVEATCPSLGVGYECAYAEKYQKPTYIFYHKGAVQLSAMLTGNPYFHIYAYEREKEIFEKIKEILA